MQRIKSNYILRDTSISSEGFTAFVIIFFFTSRTDFLTSVIMLHPVSAIGRREKVYSALTCNGGRGTSQCD